MIGLAAGGICESEMGFVEQIKITPDKAAGRGSAITRLIANFGGPTSSSRRLLMSATQPVLDCYIKAERENRSSLLFESSELSSTE